MASVAEKKFITLRKRLDQLGYRQPLGLESFLLVDRLFADLVQTTDSLRQAKSHLTRRGDLEAVLQDNVGPYKSENGRLVKTNNELHEKLIRERESFEEKMRDLKVTVRRLEHENADLKFLNSQFVHRVRAHERQSQSKDAKIAQLQEKNVQAVIQTPGGRKKGVAFRKQRMDVDSHVEPAGASRHHAVRSIAVLEPEPFVVDMMKMADLRNEQMREQIVRLEESEKASARTVQGLRKQVEVRNGEIERLQALLEGGRSIDVMLAEGKRETNEKMVAHLNIQVDYLTQVNSEMVSKLEKVQLSCRDSEERAGDLTVKNSRLCSELEEINELIKQLEDGNGAKIRQLEIHLQENKSLDERREQLVIELKKEIKELKQDRKSLMLDNQHNAELVQMAEKDVHIGRERLERVAQEKREVEGRYVKLQEKERELSLELERLRHIAIVREEDRAQRSRAEHVRVEDVVCELEERVEELGKEKEDRLMHLKNIQMKHNQIEDEMNYYRLECEKLQQQLLGSREHRFSPSKRGWEEGGLDAMKLKMERDKLQSLVAEFEKELVEIKTDTGILMSERDNFKLLYDQAADEVSRLRREQASSGHSPHHHSTQMVLRQVEQERDDALRKLSQFQQERDSLQERLRISTDAEKTSRNLVELKSIRTEGDLREVIAEREELASRVVSLRGMVSRLEEQVKTSSAAVTAARQRSSTHEERIEEMRILVEQTERGRQEQAKAQRKCQRDLEGAEAMIQEKETQLRGIVDELRSAQTEVGRLRGVIQTVDRERDSLQAELDTRTEEVIRVQGEKDMGNQTEQQLHRKIRDLESQLSVMNESLMSKHREIVSLQHQRDMASSQYQESQQGREIAVADNRRLEQDLRTMTQENQAVHHELAQCQETLQEQTVQLQIYAQQLLDYKESLDKKEDEKVDLLKSYQSLSSENEKLESSVSQTLHDVAGVHQQLLDVTMENQHLQQQYQLQAEEIGEKEKALHAYGLQVSKFSSALSRMEQELRQTRDEKRALLEERNAIRALCSKLEQDKAVLVRQVATRGAEVQQLKVTLDNEKLEVESLRREGERLNQRVQSLESILVVERQTVFHHESRRDRTSTENQQLHDQIIRLETDRQESLRELNVAREEIKKASLSPGEVSPASTSSSRKYSNEEGRASRLPDELLQARLSHPRSRSPDSLQSSILSDILGRQEETPYEREKRALEDETASVVDELMSSHSHMTESPS